ncbi:UPF0481 protein At3g47200-like [Papaver somniferum]|uniref:UPF0481 protein At3g47200-like n=1 Tax=Papaver somniferum TaxID=3469 RepID=UPI000E6F4C14|nr:UPF0481 protein At3g47200-like [Papaver somniferum]
MERKIRECYSEPVDLNSTEFVEMMVIDGLFVIGMLMRSISGSYVADDPLDGNEWLLATVEQDMLLLENQIPLFVLQCLSNIIFGAEESRLMPLKKVILISFTKILRHSLPTDGMTLLEAHPCQCEHAEHLIDFLIKLIQPPAHTNLAVYKSPCSSSSPSSWRIVKNLTELKRSFIAYEERGNLSDTSSDFIPSATELRRAGVRNLIACEQIYSGRYFMSSYASFMDFLIISADDVHVLRRKGIITNMLGCDEDVSDIFNKLCIGMSAGGDYYSTHIRDINKYYKKRRHYWKATLKREYFNTPWAIVSVLAATLLLTLTIISTVFGILSFLIPKSL